jgi:hypothetical protein
VAFSIKAPTGFAFEEPLQKPPITLSEILPQENSGLLLGHPVGDQEEFGLAHLTVLDVVRLSPAAGDDRWPIESMPSAHQPKLFYLEGLWLTPSASVTGVPCPSRTILPVQEAIDAIRLNFFGVVNNRGAMEAMKLTVDAPYLAIWRDESRAVDAMKTAGIITMLDARLQVFRSVDDQRE